MVSARINSMSRKNNLESYHCVIRAVVDRDVFHVPVDGDCREDLHEILVDMIHEIDGIELRTIRIVKKGN